MTTRTVETETDAAFVERMWRHPAGIWMPLEKERLIAIARREADWLPIETAPKDRTKVLIWIGRIEIGWWDVDQYVGKPKPFWNWGFYSKTAMRSKQPTKWRPLPPPPTIPGDGADQ